MVLGIAIADAAVIKGRWTGHRDGIWPANDRGSGLCALHTIGIGPADRAVVGVAGIARGALGQQHQRRWRGLGQLTHQATECQYGAGEHESVHGKPLGVSVDRIFDSTLRPGFGFVN